jgi:hypothetical protein
MMPHKHAVLVPVIIGLPVAPVEEMSLFLVRIPHKMIFMLFVLQAYPCLVFKRNITIHVNVTFNRHHMFVQKNTGILFSISEMHSLALGPVGRCGGGGGGEKDLGVAFQTHTKSD